MFCFDSPHCVCGVCYSDSNNFTQKEIALADTSKKDEANVQFKKLQRAEDGKKAMSEYESEGAAVRAKTARLRALRLARDAAEAEAAPKAVAAPKKKAAKAKKAKPATLSAWIKGQQGDGRLD
jgi:hypothetical protein